jgi:hypothetical protein
MSLREICRNINCRNFGARTLQRSLTESRERSCSRHSQITSGPSRRTQEGSKDNATLRLDSSFKTPTVNSPRCSFRQCAQQVSCATAFTAISLEVEL